MHQNVPLRDKNLKTNFLGDAQPSTVLTVAWLLLLGCQYQGK